MWKALLDGGWSWDTQVEIGPGPVNLTGEAMHGPSRRIVADFLLEPWRMPLAVLEAKPEGDPANRRTPVEAHAGLAAGLRVGRGSKRS